MIRPPSDKLARKTLLIAAACAALGVSIARPVAVDLAIGRTSGHAQVKLGFASFRLAFDSGQKCPNPDSCAVRVL